MGAAAVGAEDAEGAELADRARGVAVAGGFDDGEAGGDGAVADGRQAVERGGIAGVGVDPGDAVVG